jgi:glycosyltransferase 2 family protein
MKGNLRRLIFALLIGVAIYGAFVLYVGYREIDASLHVFRWSAFAAALALATLNYLVRYVRWEYYLALLGVRGVDKLDSLLVFLSGFVLTITPGKVGEVFKSAVLAQTHSVPVQRTAPIVVAERLTDVIGVVLLIVLGSAGFAGGLPWAAAGALAVAIGMVLILWRRPMLALIAWLERRPGRLAALAPKLGEAYESLRILASPAALLWPTILSVVAWGAEGVALYVVLIGFGANVGLTLSVFFYTTATLAGAIIPVPGGLGVTEAMIQEQLVRLGAVEQAAATSSMILVRFATLWWAVAVGFLALFLLRLRYPVLRGDFDPSAAEGRVKGAGST